MHWSKSEWGTRARGKLVTDHRSTIRTLTEANARCRGSQGSLSRVHFGSGNFKASKSSRSREVRERPPLQAEERERTKGRMYSRPQCDQRTREEFRATWDQARKGGKNQQVYRSCMTKSWDFILQAVGFSADVNKGLAGQGSGFWKIILAEMQTND